MIIKSDMPITRLEEPVAGEDLKYHDKHHKAMAYVRYYRGNVAGGLEYAGVIDPRFSTSILYKGNNEGQKTYELRRNLATCYNYCDPIIRRFQAMANFGISRDKNIYPSYVKEINKGVRDALITGQALFYLKTGRSNYSDNGVFNLAHLAELEKDEAVYAIQWIDPLHFVNWTDDFSEFVIRLRPDFAMMVTPEKVLNITIAPEAGHILAITESGDKPGQFVFCRPTGTGESFIKDVAPLQVKLYNLDSYLIEEVSSGCFSTTYVAGASAVEIVEGNSAPTDSSKDLIRVDDVAGRKVVLLPVGAKVDVKGADPSQAESIRKTAHQTVSEIYASVGLKPPETSAPGLVESGLALYMRHQSVTVMGQKITEQLEAFEKTVLKRLSEDSGKEIEPTVYKKESDELDSIQTVQLLFKALSEPLPPSLKEEVAVEISQKIVTFSAENKAKFEQELEDYYKEIEEDDGHEKQGSRQRRGLPSSFKVARLGKEAIARSPKDD